MEKRLLLTTGSPSLAPARRGRTTKARTSGTFVSLLARYVNLLIPELPFAHLASEATRSQLGEPRSPTRRIRPHEILARQGRRWFPNGRDQLDFQGARIA
jgi:hypothetical protein